MLGIDQTLENQVAGHPENIRRIVTCGRYWENENTRRHEDHGRYILMQIS
jgi:hypothetical protein